MKNESPPTPPGDAWDACSEGELARLGNRLRADEARRKQAGLIKVVGAAAAVALLIMVAGLTVNTGGGSAEINCQQCLAQFDTFHLHVSGQRIMPPDAFGPMRRHMVHCAECQAKFDREFPGDLEAAGIDLIAIQPPLFGPVAAVILMAR